jgi:hypothetical protein
MDTLLSVWNVTISITLKILILEISGQHSGINVGPTSIMVFKFHELTRKFSELFWIFTNFN